MAVKNTKTRIWLTIPKTTKTILEKLQPLFPEMTQSEIVDYAIVCFGEAIAERSYQKMKEMEKEKKENENI